MEEVLINNNGEKQKDTKQIVLLSFVIFHVNHS